MITVAQVRQFAPRCNAEAWAPALDQACDRFNIDTPLRIAHFLAQCGEETGGFTALVENLNYSAEALVRVWPAHFTAATADQYAHHPVAIANVAYANRMGNGDLSSGDGFRYRGRGCLQTTGRNAYAQAAQASGLDLLNQPELLEQPVNAALSAAAYWALNGCNPLADADDMVTITRRVNGGLIGLDARRASLAQAKPIFGA